MAQQTVGQALNISEAVLSRLTTAQTLIDNLATSTENFINKMDPSFLDLMDKMSRKALATSAGIAYDFGKNVPEAIDRMLNKMRGATDEMNAMGANFGKSFSESMSSIPSQSPGGAATSISELVQMMAKLVQTNAQGSDSMTAFENHVNRLIAPLSEASGAIRKFAEAQTMMSRADVTRTLDDSSQSKIEKIKDNIGSLLNLYGRLAAAKLVPNQSDAELDLLKDRLTAVKKAIEEFHKAQAVKVSVPSLEDVSKNIIAHEGQLNNLKKDYRDLFAIMGSASPSDKVFQDAAAKAVQLNEAISQLSLRMKVLPMGMEDFQRSLKRVNPDGLRQLYWMLTEARDGAEKGTQAQQMYADKLNAVKRAMVDYVQQHRAVTVSIDDMVKGIMTADVTLSALRSTFSYLQKELSNTSWSKDFAGRLKPDMEGLEQAIGKCVVRMNEYNRAQQDVMAAAANVGANALQDIGRNGVGSRNSVELERLATDLKTAMRYLDENSALWSVYRQRLSEVEAQQGKLDEKMGRTEKSMRKVKEEVIYAADSLGYYQREMQRLNASAKVNTMGSSQWANDVKNISEYAAKVDAAQRQTKLLTMSTDAFKEKMGRLRDDNAFRQMATDLFDTRRAIRESGGDIDHVNERIRMLMAAYRDMQNVQLAPKSTAIEELKKFEDVARASYEKQQAYYASRMQSEEKLAATAKAGYDSTISKIKQMEGELQALQQIQENINRTVYKKPADKDDALKKVEGDIGVLKAKIEEERKVLSAYQEECNRATEAQKKWRTEMSKPMDINAPLKAFEDSLKTMSYTELDGLLRKLEEIKRASARSQDGGLSEEFKKLDQYARVVKEELERVKSLMGEINRYSWNGNTEKMVGRADVVDQHGVKIQLEELRALQSALKADIEKTADTTTKSTAAEVEAYHRVGKAIEEIEKELYRAGAAASAPKGAERTWSDILTNMRSLDASAKSMNRDVSELITKMQSVPVHLTGGTEWQAGVDAIRNAVREYDYWKTSIIMTNDALQGSLDKLALIQRETQQTGNAAMARWDGGRGYQDMMSSIKSASTTSEKLKQDLADVQAIMEKTAKYDANGNITKEWRQLEYLLGLVNKRIRLYNEEKNKSNNSDSMSVKAALEAARTANSYNKMTQALQRLRDIQAGMTEGNKYWNEVGNAIIRTERQLDAFRTKMAGLKDQAKNMESGFAQLGMIMTQAFSIQAIGGYIKKMVEVHAQMHLQNIALRAIIQNKDKADQIFGQVQQMALQSPFTIMQLTKFAKQLAAYRIEADKLVDTTKRLADVSAGLGVDMQRIILAYGQIKAANFLRATEVRQLTEAGLNIYGELSKYFTELKGRVVSVADVMGMVYKRLVKFTDVEEVFKRITSEGGMFYDMQKKQADSIHGMLQRIQDAYTIMMDQIGTSNQSTIKWALTAIREAIASWRKFMPLIKSAVTYFGILYAFKGFGALVTSIKQASIATGTLGVMLGIATRKQQELTAAQMASGWGALIGIIAAVTYGIYTACTASDELTEKLKNQTDEAEIDANNAVGRFKILLGVLKDTSSTYQQQRDALDEIKRSYGEIFSAQEMEIDNIRKMGDDWERTEARMREYYANQLALKQEQTIREDESKKIQDAINSIVKSDAFKDAIPGYSETVGRQIMNGLVEQLKNGEIEADRFFSLFIEKLKKFYGLSKIPDMEMRRIIGSTQHFWERLGEISSKELDMPSNWGYINDIIDAIDEANDKIKDIDTSTIGVENVGQMEVNKGIEVAKEDVKQYKSLLEEVLALTKDTDEEHPLGKFIDEEGKFVSEEAEVLFNDINNLLEKMGIEALSSAKDLLPIADNFISIEKNVESVEEAVMKTLRTIYSVFLSNNPEMIAYIDRIFDKIEQGFSARDIKDEITDVFQIMAEAKNVSVDIFQGIDRQNTSNAIKELNGKYTELKETLEAVEQVKKSNLNTDLKQAMLNYYLQGQTTEEIERQMNAVNDAIHALGGKNKELDKKKSKGKDPWAERLTLMKKVNSEYEKLLKYYDKEEAKRRITESFGPAASEIFKGIGKYGDITTWLGYDKEKTANMLDDILSKQKVTPESRKKIQEEIGHLRAEIDIKIQEKALEDLKADVDEIFSAFDLTKTFSDLGVNTSMMKELFGKEPVRDIAQLRSEFEALAREAKVMDMLGEDYDKWYEGKDKKIRDIELKQQQEQTKNWIKYTKEAMSERGKIIMDAFQEQNRIMEDKTLNEPTRKLALDQAAKNMNEMLAKQDWEDFKGSDMYIRLFENISTASSESLRNMKESLLGMKDAWSNLPADQVKAIVKEIEKLEGELNSRNPFEGLAESYDKVQKLKAQGKTRSFLDDELSKYTEEEDVLKTQLTDLETLLGVRTTAIDINSLDAEQKASIAKYEKLSNDELSKEIANTQKLLATNKQNQSEVQENLDAYEQTEKKINAAKEKWGQYMDAAKKAFDMIKNVLDTMGVDMDSVGGIVADATLNLIDMAGQIVLNTMLIKALGTAMKTSMGIIGYILIALEAVATVMTTIFKAGDKAKSNQIDALKDKVDALSKSYDRIKEKIEAAYTMGDYKGSTEQARQKLEAQIRAYQEMIRLEESKKKTDKSALKEYSEAIETLKKDMADLTDEQTKALGGFGKDGRADAAQNFVDAWLDAFKETGDGLDALGESWDEYIESLLKKQAAYRIVGRRMETFFNSIDEMANAHSEMSMRQVLDRIRAMEGDVLERANEELKAFFDYFGWSGSGELLLSDLQKGIQNITAEQAAALESITNSIRFAAWRQVDLLSEMLAAVKGQYGNTGGGAELEVLRGIRQECSDVRSLLESVIRRTGTPDSRPALRVV